MIELIIDLIYTKMEKEIESNEIEFLTVTEDKKAAETAKIIRRLFKEAKYEELKKYLPKEEYDLLLKEYYRYQESLKNKK